MAFRRADAILLGLQDFRPLRVVLKIGGPLSGLSQDLAVRADQRDPGDLVLLRQPFYERAHRVERLAPNHFLNEERLGFQTRLGVLELTVLDPLRNEDTREQ